MEPFFDKNSYYAQNGETGHFWAQNRHASTFIAICSLDFSDSVPNDRYEKLA